MDLLTLGVKSIGTLKEVIVSTIRVQVHLFPSVGKHNQQVAFHGKRNVVLQIKCYDNWQLGSTELNQSFSKKSLDFPSIH